MEKLSESFSSATAASVPGQQAFDFLIVGAGFASSVLAERLANVHCARAMLVEKRSHIGGNAFDRHDVHGVLHPYGPYIFPSNSAEIFDYLSAFTAWRPYQHRVLASIDGQLLPMPINLDTVNRLYGMQLTAFEMAPWLESVAEAREKNVTSEDVVVARVGRNLYDKLFRGYTCKQWGMEPSELNASVTARVPTRTNRDDRYFTDTFQAMPRDGYTRLFELILAHPNIKLMLNTDYREVVHLLPWRHMIYTGPVDAYFNHRHGRLPYRSLAFEHQHLPQAQFQSAATVNYPNDHAYTRITEFKQLTGQVHPGTTIVYEYPRAEGDPYYPVPTPQNAAMYERYRVDAEALDDVTFAGQLATFRDYNMDQVVGQALTSFKRLRERPLGGHGAGAATLA